MTKRVALYARVSTDKAQTVENQLRQLNKVAVRLGWLDVAVSPTKASRARRVVTNAPASMPCLKVWPARNTT